MASSSPSFSASPLPSLLVFGPQASPPSCERLAHLRSLLIGSKHLETFAAGIIDLESTWRDLVAGDCSLERIPDAFEQLQSLRDWVVTGNTGVGGLPDSNIILTPLTVITHVVEYFYYLERNGFSHSEVTQHVTQHGGGYQGFCTGLLAAAALSLTAVSEGEAVRLATVVLRLALLVGAYVDLDYYTSSPPIDVASYAVRWGKDVDKALVLNSLHAFPEAYISVISDVANATVTVEKKSENLLKQRLSETGAVVHSLPLRGRFHTASNQDAYSKALSHCRSNARLRLPDSDSHSKTKAVSLLKSGSGALVAPNSPLHEVVLQSMLLDQCEWYATIRTSIADALLRSASEQTLAIATFGDHDSIPRSLSAEHKLQVINHWRTSLPPNSCSAYTPPPNAVAVVGLACRFPGADSLEEFWSLLQSGSSMLGKLPSDRFPVKGLRRTPKDDISFMGNFLRDAYAFDHKFFGKSSRESSSMDPQHKLILQVAYEALESAGYFNGTTLPSDVGCYVGVAASDYEDNVASHPATAFSVLGMVRAFVSGKISHFFGFKGPAMAFDTACSSSAVAIHTACKAIQTGDCSMALAGGVNVITSPVLHQNLAAANFLSPTGESKAFDARADGYCRGEGAGIVVLKKYSQALRDGDRVFGIITGSAVNQNDNCVPITVPVSHSQARLFRKALDAANMDSSTVSYVEAHGTGTPKGDPIECASIREVFGNKTSRKLHFGSVKSMIGHTEAASGVAGLIKVLLMMYYRSITPQASFQVLNPSIPPLGSSNMEISRSTKAWDQEFLAACINNYGAAGSNAALLVCESPASTSKATDLTATAAPLARELAGQYPVMLTAHSAVALHNYCKSLQAYIGRQSKNDPHRLLANIAYGLSRRRNPDLSYTLQAKVKTLPELQSTLDTWIAKGEAIPRHEERSSRPVVLVFSGQTSNAVLFSEELYRKSALVRRHVDDCDRIIRSMSGNGVVPRIFQQDPVLDIVELHCMLFTLQYSCAKAWIDSGLEVASVIGHSFGQLTALCVAGAMSLNDGLRIIYERATIIQRSWGSERGAMLSVELDIEAINRMINSANQLGLNVAIACYNAPNNHVLVGSKDSIQALEGLIHEQSCNLGSIKTRRIEVTHAYHSYFIDALIPQYSSLLEQIHFSKPIIPVETCSDGSSWSHVGPAVLAKQFREPVFFSQAINRIVSKLGPCVWLEAGSGTAAISLVRRALQVTSSAESKHSFHQAALFGPDPIGSLISTTLGLWNAGTHVRFWPFENRDDSLYSALLLPPYHFEKHHNSLEYIDRHQIEPAVQSSNLVTDEKPRMVSLLGFLDPAGQTAVFTVDPTTTEFQTYIKGHSVLGHPLCPVSLYIEIATRAAFLSSPGLSPNIYLPSFEGLKIFLPLGLNQRDRPKVTLEKVTGADLSWKFTLSSSQGSSSAEIKHATAIISLTLKEYAKTKSYFSRFEKLVDYRRIESLLTNPGVASIQGPLVYKLFDKVVRYSEPYRGVQKISFLEQEVAGQVMLSSNEVDESDDSVCSPLAVDNFTQVAGLHVNGLDSCADTDVYICSEIEDFHILRSMKQEGAKCKSWLVYSKHTSKNAYRDINSDIYVFDSADQTLVMMILGVRFSKTNILNMEKALSKANNSQSFIKSNVIPHDLSAIPLSNKPSSILTSTSPKKPAKVGHGNLQDDVDNIKQSLRQLLREVADIPDDEIKDDSRLDDIGIDSLMATELINAIVEKFGVCLTAAQFADITDIRTLYQAVELATDNDADSSEGSEDSQFDLEESSTPISAISADVLLADPKLRLYKLFSEHLDICEDVSPNLTLAEIGIDSLSGIELNTEIEREFGVKVDILGFDSSFTIGNLVRTIAPTQSNSTDTQTGMPVKEIVPELSTERLPRSRTDSVTQIALEDTGLLHAYEDFRSIRNDYLRFAKEAGWAGFRQDVYPKQKLLVAKYILEAFRSLGCCLDSLSTGSELPPISQVLPKHRKVMKQYGKALQEMSILEVRNGKLVRSAAPVPRVDSDSLFEDMVAEFPQYASELKLLKSTGSRLADCLTGKIDPLKILFGTKADRALMEDVYTNSPMFSTGTKILAAYIKKAFASYRGKERLQILELGAGTGGTTKDILSALSSLGVEFTYTFTDISSSLTSAAKRKFANYGSSMKYMVLDIEKAPPADQIGQYHLILSSNCIHATKDLLVSSKNIRQMLRPDGLVALLELTRNLFWLDCVFGLLEGWWLFEDGREHVLADEHRWKKTLLDAGFNHVDWSDDASEESDQFRVIVGFASTPENFKESEKLITEETVEYDKVNEIFLKADIFYPEDADPIGVKRPIALMIHGGGHIMLSRKDVRPRQTRLLLEKGLLPISIDYRLCPEVTLTEGPMVDVCTSLSWARSSLRGTRLSRADIQPDGDKVVVIGWSTGGTLAMTTAFTSLQRHIKPPDAILAFYCPSDYESDFWRLPNYPERTTAADAKQEYDLLEGIQDRPITAYNVPFEKRAVGGWLSLSDPRSRIALHMNWKGQALPTLLDGLPNKQRLLSSSSPYSSTVTTATSSNTISSSMDWQHRPIPSAERIAAISPHRQILNGIYRTPTFLIHGTADDLVPWQHTARVAEALRQQGVPSGVAIVPDAVHLLDLYRDAKGRNWDAVMRGYAFLLGQIGM